MLPEEKIASRFSRQRKLKPPINTESLVKEFAILEEDSLPEGYDAVYLDKSPKHPKPRVIITNNISKARRIFTLGHELGHILIPWHIGTHFCRVDAEAQLVDHLVKEVESQANRFAAELLMPAVWIDALLKSTGTLKELVGAVKEANVSYQAASFRLSNILPQGYAFIETDSNDVIIRTKRTAGTNILLPNDDDILNRNYLDNLAEDSASFWSGSSYIHWWRFASKLKAPKSNTVDQSASALLRQIIEHAIQDKAIRSKITMQINGVIGAANGTFKNQQKGDLFTFLKHRFAYRPDFQKVVEHPSFDVFLQKRVEELMLRD